MDQLHLAGNKRDEVLQGTLQTQVHARSSVWEQRAGFLAGCLSVLPCLLQGPLWSTSPLPAPFIARLLGLGEA